MVVVGATASGKTDLSISLAEALSAPILSADSRQFYRQMSIGTAKPTTDQLSRATHYFIDNKDITEHYSCGQYEQEALQLLDSLFEKHRDVVLCGGSGLYVDAVCKGMDALPEIDPELRESLRQRLADDGIEALLEQLQELDNEYYNTVDRNNPQRVIRALEVCITSGKTYSELRAGEAKQRDFEIVKIGIDYLREELYQRINQRVDMMITDGLEAEVRALYPFRELNSLQTVGYREFFDCFDGKISREQAIELIKRNSRRYAKRQLTWLRSDSSVRWFTPGCDMVDEVLAYLDSTQDENS